jgi:hypothetical protein
MQQSHAPQSGGVTVSPQAAAHITAAFAKVTKDLLPSVEELIQKSTDAARSLDCITFVLGCVRDDLDTYTEFMTSTRDYLFGQSGGDICKLIMLIQRDAIGYAHLAETLRACTAAGEKPEYKSKIPEAILRKATHELMKFYKEITGNEVFYAKQLPDSPQQPSTVFIFECLKVIDEDMIFSRAITAINKVRKDLKSGT